MTEALGRIEPGDSIWQVAVRSAAAREGTPFLTFEGTEFSLDDLLSMAEGLADQLQELGIEAGSKVAVMLPNSPEVLVSTLALASLGAVEVPVNTALVGPMLAHVLHHSDSEVCIVSSQLLTAVASLDPADRSGVRYAVVASESAEPLPDEANGLALQPFAQPSESAGDGFRPPTVGWSDPAAILYTSGTTGPAKGVVLSHGYMLAQAERRVNAFDFGPADKFYTCLPLFHINAKVLTLLTALLSGSSLTLARRFRLSTFWEEIAESEATFFTFIGSMAVLLLDQPPSPLERSHNARLSLGAPIPPERFAEFESRFGVPVAAGYGMTELMGALVNPPGSPEPSACGIPAEGYLCRIVDDDFNECAVDEVGELVVRPATPDQIMDGYYKQPEATVKAFQGLWFHTGDLLRKDEAGYFWFVDRKKDYLRHGGENISASEVERVISGQPDVVESAVIGVPSEQTEEDLKLIVVRRPDSSLTELELAESLQAVLPRFTWPRYIEFVDSLPKTATTRVEKFKLREDWNTPATVEIPRVASSRR